MLALGGLVLLLDQWSKRVVQLRLPAAGHGWGRVVRIRCVRNRRDAQAGRAKRMVLVLIWAAAVGSAIALHGTGAWFQSHAALLGLGAAFGGAAGNLLDLLRRRWVVDFIGVGWWPAFNLADVGIVAGLAAAFWTQV
ncbi:MAG TPA: signal peptidase II [Polyangia bacterium]|nr:signal peptidase II [Polyangia bacterium]